MPFDSKNYRRQLGFTNKKALEKHFKAADIVSINWDKIERYNQRIKDMFREINHTINPSVRWNNMSRIDREIDIAYDIIREYNILPRMNNYGRYPEDLYYNWMRGYIVCKYFTPALAVIFNVSEESIRTVGRDNLMEIETFSQSPVADLEITIDGMIVRLEIQSGYTGINDIKAHKIREAHRAFRQERILSYVVHFDLFNGTMAIVDITDIEEDNMVTRSQMEGQLVFTIPDEAFCWFLPDEPPYYLDILF